MLTYDVCIPLMRKAMERFSRGDTHQLLRSILPLGDGHMFGVMPGGLGGNAAFGAKLISVFPENVQAGGQSHQGYVILFDGQTGAPLCLVEAGELTAIRTAAASAAATALLANPDASRLAVIGSGEQARTHARAVSRVRKLSSVVVWARDPQKAATYADRMSAELGVEVQAVADAEDAVRSADIVCTTTSSREPVVLGRWIAPGTHLNLVGSSFAGPVEVDDDLVAMARFIADSREGVLAQGAEFLAAKASGRVDDGHVVGEIGQVASGDLIGRRTPEEVTVYKSLGHVVQDLAAAQALYELERAKAAVL